MTRKLTKEQRDELAKTAPALYADWAHDLDEADRELERAIRANSWIERIAPMPRR